MGQNWWFPPSEINISNNDPRNEDRSSEIVKFSLGVQLSFSSKDDEGIGFKLEEDSDKELVEPLSNNQLKNWLNILVLSLPSNEPLEMSLFEPVLSKSLEKLFPKFSLL